jgi:hypothetical protein
VRDHPLRDLAALDHHGVEVRLSRAAVARARDAEQHQHGEPEHEQRDPDVPFSVHAQLYTMPAELVRDDVGRDG